MRRSLLVLLGLVVLLGSYAQAGGRGGHRPVGPKNVIYMIPDGCDQAVVTAARWYKGEDLTLDKMVAGVKKTHMANSIITGSAAASTAFACGHKTTVRFLGIGPRENDLLTGFVPTAAPYAPVASILELAKRQGKSVGIVVTCRISHATPAGFACHIADRGWDNDITEHMVYENVDVVMGGGKRHLYPEGGVDADGDGVPDDLTGDGVPETGGKRTDGENLIQVLLDRGYSFVETRDQMNAVTSGKLWGAFQESHMNPDIDRQHFATHEPSLAEMVAKAIELLSRNPRGFFLMVEGPQVDWAGHNNDPVYMITDMIAFDDAVKVAADYADNNQNTLVMAFPDHNTGGMKIGHYGSDARTPYTATTIEMLVDPLKGMTMTSVGVAKMIAGDLSPANIKDKLQSHWGITATDEDVAEILALESQVGLNYAIARVISKNHTVIGWTTHGHNGEEVPVWMYPATYSLQTIDNTELPRMVATMLNGDLDALTGDLYVNVEDAFPGEWTLDKSDPENSVLVVKNRFRFPCSKDLMLYKGMEFQLGSLVVYAPLRDGDASDGDIHTVIEDRVFIPKIAVWAVKWLSRWH